MKTNGQNTDKKHRRNTSGLRPPWPKGVSGNPGGRPKRDFAAEIARAVIEGNREAIEKAFGKKLRKGDTKAFIALSDRGYGKAPQSAAVTGGDDGPVVVKFVNVDEIEEA